MKGLKGYKGFNKDFTCRGKQYKENTVFEEKEAVICNSGMHFCESPLEVLEYYGFVNEKGEINEFAAVEALEDTKTNDKKKFCTTKLKIGAKLGLKGFVEACVDFLLEKTELEDTDCDNSGDSAQIGSSGDSAKIGSSGDSAQIGSSGYAAQIGSSGYAAQIGSSGDAAKIGSSGNYAQIDSTGEDAVVMCAGYGSVAKAKKGSWITLAEWKYSKEKGRHIPVCVKTEQVDGVNIKEDVFYKLENGKFKEV